MSFSPGNILQRLQELRNWQQHHQDFLKIHPNNTNSNYETIDGISAFDTLSPTSNNGDLDAKPITPQKTFIQLLEEKLQENDGNVDEQAGVLNRPKRPFLRKGSGLKRFRMSGDDFKKRQTLAHTRKPRKSDRMLEIKTPLKTPGFTIKPKASWTTIVENEETNELASPSEQTLYEKVLEKELQIFETLEEKVENGSFCSTNSSILRIFTTTPQKTTKTTNNDNNSDVEKHVRWQHDVIIDDEPQINPNIDVKKLLQHLQCNNNGANTKKPCNSVMIQSSPLSSSSSDGDDDDTDCSSNISITSTDLETTLEHKKHCDIGVNTCNLAEINEHVALKRQIDDLNQKYVDLNRKFALEKQQLQSQIDNEKQKSNKLQKQTNLVNKDRELIKNLKQELIDVKETMKLKDTKNGTTQARLRNQIKQLEKDNNKLKDEIDDLLKQNAKLQAIQKLNQNNNNNNKTKTETKILKEINENVNKLMENGKKPATNRANNDNNNDSLLDFTNFKITDCQHIEKQYETVFNKDKLVTNNTLNDSGKTDRCETIQADGSKEIKYPNGNLKIISSDGNTIIMKYYNGDIKQTTLIDGIIKYYYNDKNIWQITHNDGTELIEYPEGHKEKRYRDGKCEIIFPDGMLQTIQQNGEQHINYPDGSVLKLDRNGDKTLNLPNGQKEIQTKDHKRREYPDGTIKIIYNNGIQETHYSNGRIRKKDGNGTLIFDNFSPVVP